MGPYEQRLRADHLERRRRFFRPKAPVVHEPRSPCVVLQLPRALPPTMPDPELPPPPRGKRTANALARWCANRFGWQFADFTRPGRQVGTMLARTATVYIVKQKVPHISLASISRALRRDHTTFIKNLRKFDRELERRPVLAHFVNNLMAELD